MDKTILLASFIINERKDWFLKYLEDKFNIKEQNVFIYENLSDTTKKIYTYKLILKEGERINFKKTFPNAVTIHKRGTALYTINALNKLIEKEYPESIGNIDFKSVKIDWSKYQNNFIVIDNDELVFLPIKQILSKN